MTLHPALQNFRVDIREAFAIPGTMCASVMAEGNHGMSRLHVWVDFNFIPFGMAIVMGRLAICLFTTGAPSMMKWLVAPESETAHSTALVRNFRLNVVVRRFSCRLFACFSASVLLSIHVGLYHWAVSLVAWFWWAYSSCRRLLFLLYIHVHRLRADIGRHDCDVVVVLLLVLRGKDTISVIVIDYV